jgi:predicted transcriptional regulator
VSSPRLEAIVKHDGRLDVLCCLLDGGPLGVSQLAARINESVQAVRYWVRLLEAFSLIEKIADLHGQEPLYAVTLQDHPDWVREAIDEHRY